MNIVITGANRGIGLGFVRHYLAQGHRVWACYRVSKGELAQIDSPHLKTLVWDVSSDDGPDFGRDAHSEAAWPDTVDLLINNAGIYGPGKGGQCLQQISAEAMQQVFNVDCIGPLRVVQILSSRIIAAAGMIANVSSKMGSSTDNASGGTYAYRAAKAGLIMVSKSMAVDLAAFGVHVISLHPGWVQTDMTHQTGLIDVHTSVTGMAAVIAAREQYEAGLFVAYDGKIVPY